MNCIKVFMFYVFLNLACKVEADIKEKDEPQTGTSTANLLQVSESIQPYDNDTLEPAANISAIEDRIDFKNISNDVEVFKEKLELQKENQEEAPEAEPDVKAEEPKEEESDTEAKPDTDPAVEPAAEVDAEPVDEPAANPETPKEEEIEAEAAPEAEAKPTSESDAEPAAEPEPEAEKELNPESEPTATAEEETKNIQSDDEQKTPEVTTGNDETKMSNDEPAKEDEKDKTEISATKDIDKNEIFCYTCTSTEDSKCAIKSTHQVLCPKVNVGDAGKHNGCYTLFQEDTNITMRGCVDELAEGGLKYCLSHENFCNLCYSNGCNNKMAPSNAAKLQSTNFSIELFIISSILIKKYAAYSFK